MPYPCNLLGTKNLYIKIPNMIMDNLYPATGDHITLINIPVNVSPYSLVLFMNGSNTKSIIKNQIFPTELDIQIYDDSNNLVDFNNIEFNITLEIENYIDINAFNSEE
jgi:hypothetical protein